MLEDILSFAFTMLVNHGRISLWMPTANDEDVELEIPGHPGLELVSVCVQEFNKCKMHALDKRLSSFTDNEQGLGGFSLTKGYRMLL